MNGAESLARTLVAGGVNVCFTNPGTSEMHFVAALDKVDGIRCVLGSVRGRGDGGGRRLLANGRAAGGDAAASWARAREWSRQSPQREEGQLRHRQHRGRARHVSHQARRSAHRRHRGHRAAGLGVGAHVAEREGRRRRRRGGHRCGMGAARPDRHAHPARRYRVERGGRRGDRSAAGRARPRRADAVARCAKALRSGEPAMLLLTGQALRENGLALAGRIATATGARILAQGSNARIARGAGRVPIERLPYPVDQALGVLKDVRHLILVGSKAPVAFFAYPDKPSVLTPDALRDPPAVDAGGGFDLGARVAGRRGRREEERRGRAAGDPARAAHRPAHARYARRLARRAAARGRNRRRRVGDDGPRLLPHDRGRAAARLDEQHGRLHRPRHAARHGRRRRMPGSEGPLPRGRRQRHVHACRRSGRRRASNST